jgi:DNA-binding LytR/AlgR family response regulator
VAIRRTVRERAAQLVGILPHLEALVSKSTKIAIKTKGRILFIDPADVVIVEAQGNYVLLHRPSGSYLLRESISTMAEKLKPYGFIRIHRSVVVNSSFVEEIQPWSTGEYVLRIKGGKEYTVTRMYKKNVKPIRPPLDRCRKLRWRMTIRNGLRRTLHVQYFASVGP